MNTQRLLPLKFAVSCNKVAGRPVEWISNVEVDILQTSSPKIANLGVPLRKTGNILSFGREYGVGSGGLGFGFLFVFVGRFG